MSVPKSATVFFKMGFDLALAAASRDHSTAHQTCLRTPIQQQGQQLDSRALGEDEIVIDDQLVLTLGTRYKLVTRRGQTTIEVQVMDSDRLG